jgi:hypothetical protein
MDIDQYIRQLAAELGIEETLNPDEYDVYRIPLEDNLTICAKQIGSRGGYYFFSTIALFPQIDAEKVLVAMMTGNLFGHLSGEGALALDRIGEQILYVLYTPYDLNYHDFYDRIESMANYVDYWKKEVRKLQGLL